MTKFKLEIDLDKGDTAAFQRVARGRADAMNLLATYLIASCLGSLHGRYTDPDFRERTQRMIDNQIAKWDKKSRSARASPK